MLLHLILVTKHFDILNTDFLRLFLNSFGNLYILVLVDCISKWAETVPCKTNDNKILIKFLKENIFFDSIHYELS